jgi:hypothetical protein
MATDNAAVHDDNPATNAEPEFVDDEVEVEGETKAKDETKIEPARTPIGARTRPV